MDWTSLDKPPTIFVVTTVICLILATQTSSPLFAVPKSAEFDAEIIEETFSKALANVEVSQGLSVLLRRHMDSEAISRTCEGLGMDERSRKMVVRGVKIAQEALKGIV